MKLVILSSLAVFLVGCGQSGTGGFGSGETGTETDNAFITTNVIEMDSKTEGATVKSEDDSAVDSSLAPAIPAPEPSTTNGAAPEQQGTQTVPEPNTGDDANPERAEDPGVGYPPN